MRGLRARLREQPGLLATFSLVPAPEIAEIAIVAGFDAVIVDLEHGPISRETAVAMTTAAQGRGAYVLWRLSGQDPAGIGMALDCGADGVVVPQVATAAQAAAAVAAARFAPEGCRGANPYVRAAGFGDDELWFAEANDSAAVLVLVEGQEGLANLDGILDVQGLDGVFLGPVDLSHSLGLRGQPEHPTVVQRMREAASAASEHGLACAAFAPAPPAASRWLDAGFGLVALAVDTTLALQGMRDAVCRVQPRVYSGDDSLKRA